jgi:DNA-binding XRE family transcriptional regulator
MIRNELQGCNKKEINLQYHFYCISWGMEHTISTLEAHRKFIGMTQAQLCYVLDIQPSTYYRWRKNGTTPVKVREVHTALLKFAKHKNLPLP